MGYKVLAVDCDPQGHLTKFLLEDRNMQHQGIFEVMSSNVPIEFYSDRNHARIWCDTI